ncbi:MAG TPA: hypothetical protein VGO89_13010 [Streptomyces sp.]|nr:hypothetical protein [Streptomyces sp.]
MSNQITGLGKPGYVKAEKGYVGKRPRTWLDLDDARRSLMKGHAAALQGRSSPRGKPAKPATPTSADTETVTAGDERNATRRPLRPDPRHGASRRPD